MCTKISIEDVRTRLTELYKGIFTFPYLDKEYVNTKGKITLVCPIHGPHHRYVNSLMFKHSGCALCKPIRRSFQAFYGRKITSSDMDKLYTFIAENGPIPPETFTNQVKLNNLFKKFYRKIMGYE